MDEKRLAEIQARCDAATPGPWKADAALDGWECEAIGPGFGDTQGVLAQAAADAAFIAAARDDVPALLSFVTTLAAERDQARSDAEAARKEAACQERARHLNGQIADGFKAEVELLRGMSAGEVAEQNSLVTVNLRLSLHEKCGKLGAPDYWVERVVAAEKSVKEAAEFKAMLQKRLDEAHSSMMAMEARIAELEGVWADQSNALQAAAAEYPTGPVHPRQERLHGSSVLATIDAPPPDELREACRPANGCQHTRYDMSFVNFTVPSDIHEGGPNERTAAVVAEAFTVALYGAAARDEARLKHADRPGHYVCGSANDYFIHIEADGYRLSARYGVPAWVGPWLEHRFDAWLRVPRSAP